MIPAQKMRFVVRTDASIREALARIDENEHRSVIVLSSEGTVAGTLTDGDVRKALLDGRLLEAPVSDVMNTNFISVVDGEAKKAEAIFREKKHILLIPVVDGRSKLVDVLTSY